ncbi:MAG: ABC transporter ATP-binding protein [Phycisphaerae bacterium]|nr:ABC transporter ATP-binding protein [Phycisphaerae bacterium]
MSSGSGASAVSALSGPAPEPGWGEPIIELRGVKKTYRKPDGSIAVEALKMLDLAVPRGQFVAIMGASGSGKSTLMNILGCLDKPTEGAFFLDGQDCAAMSDEELSRTRGRKMGFVFQAFNLVPELTVAENVEVPLFYQAVPKRERRTRSEAVLRDVGLGDRMEHRPSELSGGQQQRAAIARALVTRPVVLLADEPTGNLDSATGESILRTLEGLHSHGMTIIMVTHDEGISRRCERVVRLKDGVVERDELLRRRERAVS